MVKASYLNSPMMIVDAHEEDRNSLSEKLGDMGFTGVIAFSSAEECLQYLRGKRMRSGLVILDIALPEEASVDLAHKLMNHYRLPFVFATRLEDSSKLQSVNDTIPFGIITKPCDRAVLEFSIESAFTLIELRKLLTIKNEDLGKANRIVAEQKSDLIESIESARDIHRAILPNPEGFRHHVKDFYLMNRPKSLIGGDFFWHYEIDSYHILFAVVDCTGHAISGSLVSILANDNLNRIVRDYEVTEPADILWLIDRQMMETTASNDSNSLEASPGMELVMCNLDLKNRILRFSGARRPLYLLRDGSLEIHKGYHAGVGLYGERKKNFRKNSLELQDGDRILLFSDGYTDQIGGDNIKKLKSSGLQQLVNESARLSVQ